MIGMDIILAEVLKLEADQSDERRTYSPTCASDHREWIEGVQVVGCEDDETDEEEGCADNPLGEES